MGSKTVEVFLPRFKMTDTLDLIPPLCSLGMVAAFSAREADFLGMTVKEVIDLYIEKVVQKSYVEVNEEGTEAAAVTVIQMPMKGAREPAPIPVFRADHPFMFLIRYRPTNCILFMGRVVKPDLN
jgi:serpin B